MKQPRPSRPAEVTHLGSSQCGRNPPPTQSRPAIPGRPPTPNSLHDSTEMLNSLNRTLELMQEFRADDEYRKAIERSILIAMSNLLSTSVTIKDWKEDTCEN